MCFLAMGFGRGNTAKPIALRTTNSLAQPLAFEKGNTDKGKENQRIKDVKIGMGWLRKSLRGREGKGKKTT